MLRREQCAFLAAVLVGAYGVDRGLRALVALAATYHATRFFLLKRAVRAIRRLKELREAAARRSNELRGMLLEEYKIRAFQSVSLKLFDMPRQPRRMRQAVKIWRAWQMQTKLKARLNDIRGDGLNALHKTEEDLREAMSAVGLESTSPSTHAVTVDPKLDAFRACSACRGMSSSALEALAAKAKTVCVTARESSSAFTSRDALTILVDGEVEFMGQIDAHSSDDDARAQSSMMTRCSRPGTCLNSFMDILEHVPDEREDATATAVSALSENSEKERVRVSLTIGSERHIPTRDRTSVSVRASNRGCVLATVSMADYHECAGVILGIQGIALKLTGGFAAVCKYLGMMHDMKSLWVHKSETVSSTGDERLACDGALTALFSNDVAKSIDTSNVIATLERSGYRKRTSTTESSKSGGFFSNRKQKQESEEVKSKSNLALEAKDFTSGEIVLRQGDSPVALIVERGSLEAFVGLPRTSAREKPPLPNSPLRFHQPDGAPIFTANVGDVVGSHLLLTGQRSNLTIRAGLSGAVVAFLPLSALARLGRQHAHVNRKMAIALARRVREAASSLVLDRCGAEIEQLEAGEALNHREGGVHIVVTGCLREQMEEQSLSRTNSTNNLFRWRKSQGSKGVSTSYATVAHGLAVNPGEATGEDSVLMESTASRPVASMAKARRLNATAPGAKFVARAVRDSQVVWIPSAGLDTLALAAPTAFVRLARGLGLRQANRAVALSASPHGAPNMPGLNPSHKAPNAPKVVSIIPVTEGAAVHLDEFCYSLAFALSKVCRARTVDSACRLGDLGSAAVGPLAHEATAYWLSQLESAYDVVILKGDPFPSPWCAECARHSDTILLVASASDQAPTETEGHTLQDRLLHGQGDMKFNRILLAQRELVLLHQDVDVTPKDSKSWLRAFSVQRHHHIAMHHASGLVPSHAARLARSLRELTVGLVMGGGGARGLAHVGVLAAMEEEGVPIDAVGGTSIGAMVGGMYARDPSALLVRAMITKFAKEMSSTWGRFMDLTLPVVSYFTGWGMNRTLGLALGETKIEDCWLPFFCCTLDLISCMPIVHRNGTLWRYIRASMALVGFLPPVCDTERGHQENMHVLVDGGYVNNLPTDVMRALGAHYVIAVDVAGEGLDARKLVPWGDGISGTWLLLRSLLPRWLGGGHRIPTMADMQSQLPFVTDTVKHQTRLEDIDVYVRPNVSHVGILEFNRYNTIIRQGYEQGLKMAREWKAHNPDVALLLEQGMHIRGGLATLQKPRRANIPSAFNSRETLASDSSEDVQNYDLGLKVHHTNAFNGDFSDDDEFATSNVRMLLRTTSAASATDLTWTPAPKQKRRRDAQDVAF